MSMEPPKTFYRFTDYTSGSNVYVCRHSYPLQKETAQGYWIGAHSFDTHWISKTSKKRYAYPTPEEAWTSFKWRKSRQVMFATQRLARAKAAAGLTEMPEEQVLRAGSIETLQLSTWDL